MARAFEKVLVANRGEIAVRAIRALKEMGIASALACAPPDKGSLAARLADELVPLEHPYGYLDVQALVGSAKRCGADALYPGYGFLSESAEFAGACLEAGLVWIGPPPAALRLSGDKQAARRAAKKAGIPIVPGSDGPVSSAEEAVAVAGSLGYPVLLKAVAGGGGRGMRVVAEAGQMAPSFERASSEAQKAFGSGALYIEKYLGGVRHVEVQVIVDQGGRAVHLGERDCTVQRRHQKLVEESPSPAVEARPGLRERMGAAATRLMERIGYVGAGTVEFLLDEDGNFYFIEVNARIQVEHPVTEMVTGLDLVREQIRIAAGEPLSVGQDQVVLRGWAIECRINTEDPQRNFLPSPGRVEAYLPPGGPGVRVDSAAFAGWEVPPFYDSLVAKLIAWAPDRHAALARMARALAEFEIGGLKTTIPFHRWLMGHGAFRSGDLNTRFVEEHFKPGELPAELLAGARAVLPEPFPGAGSGPESQPAGGNPVPKGLEPPEPEPRPAEQQVSLSPWPSGHQASPAQWPEVAPGAVDPQVPADHAAAAVGAVAAVLTQKGRFRIRRLQPWREGGPGPEGVNGGRSEQEGRSGQGGWTGPGAWSGQGELTGQAGRADSGFIVVRSGPQPWALLGRERLAAARHAVLMAPRPRPQSPAAPGRALPAGGQAQTPRSGQQR